MTLKSQNSTKDLNSLQSDGWLMLVYQIPAKPAYLRVKIHRRLKMIGAVSVKNSVNVLPDDEDTREDFHWLKKEIDDGGGEAMIIHATLVAGLTNQAVIQLFIDLRSKDYGELADEVREVLLQFENGSNGDNRANLIRKFGNRLDQIVDLDFFDADGRETVNGLLRKLESESGDKTMKEATALDDRVQILPGQTWVTRTGVRIDRIASAWLINRFIDGQAKFKFVAASGYIPEKGELRFDMFEAEYTHIGDQCTFEVLLQLIEAEDNSLKAIAEIIHDLDIKDGRYGRMENAGVKSLIEGICLANEDDNKRFVRGSEVFNDLYLYFQSVLSK
jgi:hypothetical protein